MRTWPALLVDRLESNGADDTGGPDLFEAALTDYDVAAIEETSSTSRRVFFHATAERDRAARALCVAFSHLAIEPLDVADEDWAARSQADLHAVRIGHVIVAPPWDVPVSDEALVIVIQPSMGFGTGHHATTRLCLAALQQIDVRGRTVIDIGTGSGVLAMTASLLGGEDVVGVDDDADAIQAARENLALNPEASCDLILGDLRSLALVPSEIVIANLTGGLLIAAAAELQRVATASGRLILSGFQADEEAHVLRAYRAKAVERKSEDDGWICVTLAKA
jgi:ribosomal protein L11 methyltransferase